MLKRWSYAKLFVIEVILNLVSLLKWKVLKSMEVRVKNKMARRDKIKNNKINKEMIQFPNYQPNTTTCSACPYGTWLIKRLKKLKDKKKKRKDNF